MQTPELNRSPDSRVDVEQLHLWRLARLRDELRSRDCAAGLFYDPMNIRYATGTSKMLSRSGLKWLTSMHRADTEVEPPVLELRGTER